MVLKKNSEQTKWSDRIVFSDEFTFFMSGIVNHHNDFYHKKETPHAYEEVHIRSKDTVFLAVSFHRIGLVAFDISEGTMNTNSDRYSKILCGKVFPKPSNTSVF